MRASIQVTRFTWPGRDSAIGPMLDIRLATADDAPGVLEIYAPIVADTAISFEVAPPSVAEMRERIHQTLPAYPWLVVEDRGRVVGYAYAHRFADRAAYNWSVETSVYVHPEARGLGVGGRSTSRSSPSSPSRIIVRPSPASPCRTLPVSAFTKRSGSVKSGSTAGWDGSSGPGMT